MHTSLLRLAVIEVGDHCSTCLGWLWCLIILGSGRKKYLVRCNAMSTVILGLELDGVFDRHWAPYSEFHSVFLFLLFLVWNGILNNVT